MPLLYSFKTLFKKKEYNYWRSDCCDAPVISIDDSFRVTCVKCGKDSTSQHNIVPYKLR